MLRDQAPTSPRGPASPDQEDADRAAAVRSPVGSSALQVSTDAMLGAAVAAAFALYVFVTTGGDNLGANTWSEIVLVLLGAGIGVAAVLRSARGRAWGTATVWLFAALAALTIASISWSVQPATSWVEANRTVSYLAAFGGAVALARLTPTRWPALVGAVAAGTSILCGYALLVKVFPGTFDPIDQIGRLRLPFGYWNAVGLIAAIGLPACLWAGARRERAVALRALAVPAIAVLVTTLVLSYSRSAVAVAVIGLAYWFAVVPLRLRAASVLGLGAAGAGVLIAWALATHPLTHDHELLAARTSAGHSFGVLLVVVLGAMTIAGFALQFAIDRVPVPERLRRRIATALLCLVALVPIAAVVTVAASSRGLTGEISHVWNSLTGSSPPVVGDSAGRLLELGNSHSVYWREGLKVGEHALLKGVGASGFATAQGFYYSAQKVAQDAHSYEVETFADLGLLGVLVSVALFVAWVVCAKRAVAFRRGAPEELAAERAGLHTLIAIVLVYGLQASVDWTWFIPGPTLLALVCAGWIAGRGPLSRPVGVVPERRITIGSPRAAASLAVIAGGLLLVCWAMWQPLRSADADGAAVTALANGNTAAALADARTAANSDPLDYQPLWTEAAVYSRLGDRTAVIAAYRKAISVQPKNAQTWQRLGEYDLQIHRARAALPVLLTAHRLDLATADLALSCAEQELHGHPAPSGCGQIS
jgi:F0F1-type ATP synthase assembly protein I